MLGKQIRDQANTAHRVGLALSVGSAEQSGGKLRERSEKEGGEKDRERQGQSEE